MGKLAGKLLVIGTLGCDQYKEFSGKINVMLA